MPSLGIAGEAGREDSPDPGGRPYAGEPGEGS